MALVTKICDDCLQKGYSIVVQMPQTITPCDCCEQMAPCNEIDSAVLVNVTKATSQGAAAGPPADTATRSATTDDVLRALADTTDSLNQLSDRIDAFAQQAGLPVTEPDSNAPAGLIDGLATIGGQGLNAAGSLVDTGVKVGTAIIVTSATLVGSILTGAGQIVMSLTPDRPTAQPPTAAK